MTSVPGNSAPNSAQWVQVPRLGDGDRDRLRQMVGAWRLPDGRDGPRPLADVAAFSQRSQEMFELLAAACGNRWLLDMFLRLSSHVARTWIYVLTREAGPGLGRFVEDWNATVGAHDLSAIDETLPELIVASGRIAESWFTSPRPAGRHTT